jgi:pimeloyl-ACP methyl ester carboxylesterase
LDEQQGLRLPLHVEIHGDAGEPILLLHGLGGNAYTWRHWVPELARSRRVVLVEMKGFGAAPKPRDDRYSPMDQAELLFRAILQEDLRDLTLVGHSLGGAIVLLTSLILLDQEPERLSSLVLVGGAGLPCLPRHVGLARIPLLGKIWVRSLPARSMVRYALRLAVHDRKTITASQVEAYAEPLTGKDARHALKETIRQLIPPDTDAIVERYSELNVPTLLLWGETDRVVPPWVAEELERRLPDAHLHLLEECGHIPPEEKPEESLDILMGFLKKTEQS